jgi:hypothetical protein
MQALSGSSLASHRTWHEPQHSFVESQLHIVAAPSPAPLTVREALNKFVAAGASPHSGGLRHKQMLATPLGIAALCALHSKSRIRSALCSRRFVQRFPGSRSAHPRSDTFWRPARARRIYLHPLGPRFTDASAHPFVFPAFAGMTKGWAAMIGNCVAMTMEKLHGTRGEGADPVSLQFSMVLARHPHRMKRNALVCNSLPLWGRVGVGACGVGADAPACLMRRQPPSLPSPKGGRRKTSETMWIVSLQPRRRCA